MVELVIGAFTEGMKRLAITILIGVPFVLLGLWKLVEIIIWIIGKF